MTTQNSGALAFAKGHGTENDFVIVDDHDASRPLTPSAVAALCDRHAGIGADGLLRVVRTGALVAAGELAQKPEGLTDDDWFMDYRNADGSVAEMCGNGVRVFAHWLAVNGLIDTGADAPLAVGTRAGRKETRVHHADPVAADVSVDMGDIEVTGVSTAAMGDFSFAGIGVDVGNPHLAAVIPGLTPEQLKELCFSAPDFDREFFPDGVNVEILTELDRDDLSVSMRVFERGVGETRSCGTGTVAAAQAALADAGIEDGTVTVRVPGGVVSVTVEDGHATLRGPSRLVAGGEVKPGFLASGQ